MMKLVFLKLAARFCPFAENLRLVKVGTEHNQVALCPDNFFPCDFFQTYILIESKLALLTHNFPLQIFCTNILLAQQTRFLS